MKKAKFIYIVIPIVCLFLNGCFGYARFHPHKRSYTKIQIKEGISNTGRNAKLIFESKDQIISEKGTPDKTYINTKGEYVMRYNNGLSWGGFAMAIIVPVLVIIPVSNSYVEYVFISKDDVIPDHVVRKFTRKEGEWAINSSPVYPFDNINDTDF